MSLNMYKAVAIHDLTPNKLSSQKLEHYNNWLMDPTRELTAVYPGFPGEALENPALSNSSNVINELAVVEGSNEESENTQARRKVKRSKKINELAGSNKRVALSTGAFTMDTSVETTHTQGNDMKKETNLSRATDLVRIGIDAGVRKGDMIQSIQDLLNVTRSNAFVYFTKACKALGTKITVDRDQQKQDQADANALGCRVGTALPRKSRKVNPITETSPEKAAAKIAEIDRVIAGLRQSGATVSPFSGLGQ